MTKAHLCDRVALVNDKDALGIAAYRSILRCDTAAMARLGSSAATRGTRNRDPADARIVLGLNGFTDPLTKMTPVAPKASAARTIAPALPGSWIPSRIISRGLPRTSWSRCHAGGFTSAIT